MQHQRLLEWYQIHGRKNLPWRNLAGDNAGYGVYISEIMLQQTQVSVVLPYYKRFMQCFPTFSHLMQAQEDAVLVLWRGLGYYSRAKNILRSAKIAQGILPSDLQSLLRLPGIGEYTAGAILCFGFGKTVSFYDTNIKRFLSRYFALQNPNHKTLKEYAQKFLNLNDAFNHNQALLDLGAMVCIARDARCNICPLQEYCRGKENPMQYNKIKKIEYQRIILHLGIYQQNNKFAMFRDSQYNMLYNFPEIPQEQTGQFIGSITHVRTKYKIKAMLYCLDKCPKAKGLEMVENIKNLPISSLSIKVFRKMGVDV